VYARRGIEMTADEKNILTHVFNSTARTRK